MFWNKIQMHSYNKYKKNNNLEIKQIVSKILHSILQSILMIP